VHGRAVIRSFTYRWFLSIFAVLFLAVQSHNVVHAASHIDSPEHTDCISCDVFIAAEDQDVVLPVDPVFAASIPTVSDKVYAEHSSALIIGARNRAPPPRAPPVTS